MLELERNNLMVTWENIGEGICGDYTGEDWDVNLLRFYVLQKHTGEPFFEDVEDASYCTRVPADTDEEILMKLLEQIADRVEEPLMAGQSIKKICEELSWMEV